MAKAKTKMIICLKTFFTYLYFVYLFLVLLHSYSYTPACSSTPGYKQSCCILISQVCCCSDDGMRKMIKKNLQLFEGQFGVLLFLYSVILTKASFLNFPVAGFL